MEGVLGPNFFAVAGSATKGFLGLFNFTGLVVGVVGFLGATFGLTGRRGAEDNDPVAIAVAGRTKTGRTGEVDACADSGRSNFAA